MNPLPWAAALLHALLHALPALERLGITTVDFFEKLFTPLKRLGTGEEVAHLIAYLGSRAADFVTGQTFTIDGGASLWGDTWLIPDAPGDAGGASLPIAGGSK